jgi:hypothetical protein
LIETVTKGPVRESMGESENFIYQVNPGIQGGREPVGHGQHLYVLCVCFDLLVRMTEITVIG